MYTFLIVLICVCAVILVLVVLAQNPKSGMAANFASSNQVMGVRQTADFLEKFTWGLAIAIVLLSLAATMAFPKKSVLDSNAAIERSREVDNEEGIKNEGLPFNLPAQTEDAASENSNSENK